MPRSTQKTSTSDDRLVIGRLIQRGAAAIVVVALLVAILGGYAAARFLQLDADTNNLIADDRPVVCVSNGGSDAFLSMQNGQRAIQLSSGL